MAEMNEPWRLWRRKWVNGDKWQQCIEPIAFGDEWEFELIANTISINGVEVPRPMQEQPEFGQLYWFVDSSYESGVCAVVWSGDNYDYYRFINGFCHLTRENCIIHAKALFSFTEVK